MILICMPAKTGDGSRCEVKKMDAYFTVEAALLFPLATGALLLTIFLFVFQYDRCLLEQDIGLLTLYAGTLEGDDAGETETLVRRRASELSKEKYAAWEPEELEITLRGGEVSIRGAGRMTFPLPEWNFFGTGNEWRVDVFRRSIRLSSVDFIRAYRRIQEEIENAD